MDATQLENGSLELREEHFCLNTMCDNIIRIAEEKSSAKNLRFESYIDIGQLSMRLGDPQRLKQVLLNLLSNAVKFTNDGIVTLHIKEYGEHVEFSVRDTGIGIQPSMIEKIQNIFEQEDSTLSRQYNGLGVGLAISCCIIRLLGGVLNISSSVGMGSKFSFKIPLRFTAQQKSLSNGKLDPSFTNATIMVVDDQPLNLQILDRMLKKLGCEVILAADGFDALLKYNQSSPPHFILMDIQMPILDGLDTTEKMRKAGIVTPIIALTANVVAGMKTKCLESGMNEYVVKPISLPRLIDLINRYCIEKIEM